MSLGNFQNGRSSFPQVWQPMMISNFLQLLPLSFTQLKFQWWGHSSPPDYNKTASPDSLRYLIFKVHHRALLMSPTIYRRAFSDDPSSGEVIGQAYYVR
jgi:hypothetical protein